MNIFKSLLISLVLAASSAAAQNIERGKSLFSACERCHQIGENATSAIGPPLNQIFSKSVGVDPRFAYSIGFQMAQAKGMTWSKETLNEFLEAPFEVIPSNSMNFRGFSEAVDRRDVIEYLWQFRDTQSPQLVAPSEEAEGANSTTPVVITLAEPDPVPSEELLDKDGDVALGQYLASACLTCHQADNSNQGLASIYDWPRESFISAMMGYRAKTRTNQVMQIQASSLSDEEILALADYFSIALTIK